MEEEKKTFSENAKGFLSDWKKEYADDNKEIIESKKKRDEETAKLYADFHKELAEYKVHLQGKSKELMDNMVIYFNAFTEEFKKGTATVMQKLQLEKRMEELGGFMKTAGEKGSDQFNKFVTKFKQKLDSFDKELESEKFVETENEIDNLQKEADELLKKSEEKDFKNIFGDL
jgi:hypothetical protein